MQGFREVYIQGLVIKTFHISRFLIWNLYNLEELLPKDWKLFIHAAQKDQSPNLPPLTLSLAPETI